MRSYERNSPKAAARIVALTMLADGNLCRRELDVLERHGVHAGLGLDREGMQAVVRELCEDLLAAADPHWSAACRIDPRTLRAMLAEIDDRPLRRQVLRLCVAVVAADDHVAENESIVLLCAVEAWGLDRDGALAGSTIDAPAH